MSEKPTISQCMIVKNEERNIEKALSWGRSIVSEQIVVDTGSTDRTVEIAERIGAKVLHFEWVDDFAAAKNFALEQATGDWIAFLDADEYIPDDDLLKLSLLLETIHKDAKSRMKYRAIICPMIHVDDTGSPIGTNMHMRFFRNLSDIRYVGRIHETLSVDSVNVLSTGDFKIIHTGYRDSSFTQTDKIMRNIELLRREIEDKPFDKNLKAYLADVLLAYAVHRDAQQCSGGQKSGELLCEDARNEALKLYKEVLDIGNERSNEKYNGAGKHDGKTHHSNGETYDGDKLLPDLKKNAYRALTDTYAGISGADLQYDEICKRAYDDFPDDYLFACYKAMSLNKNGDYRAAYNLLRECEENFDKQAEGAVLTTQVMWMFSAQMASAAQGLGDMETAVKYTEVLLMTDKTNLSVLQLYISRLFALYTSCDVVLKVLAGVFDLSDKNDLLLLARAAKQCMAIELTMKVLELNAAL